MGYIIEKEIKSVNEILEKYNISNDLKKQIEIDRTEIINIIEGKDKRKILIIGPCSAWPNTAVIEYAEKIKEIEKIVSNKLKIILRVYTQKPRTTLGWTGPANQKNPYDLANLEDGIIYCRKMMIDVLNIGLPLADEALFTHNEGYFNDLLSWIAIGARSSEDQEHRIFASMIDHPVGLKNPTSGNLDIAINSVISAQNSHVFLLNKRQIKTFGNHHAHLVLRGGNSKSNIFFNDLQKTVSKLTDSNLKNKSIIVDVSHDNSIDPSTNKKDPLKQAEALLRVIKHMKTDDINLNKYIKGFMLESFLKTGSQNLNNYNSISKLNLDGLSITDSCIGFEETKNLIQKIHKLL